MDAQIGNLIKESITTTGTGLNMALAAITGFARYSDQFPVDTLVEYAVRDGNDWEEGIGTVKTGNTLDRTTPLATYVSGVYDDSSPSRINLSGSAVVACAPSKRLIEELARSFRPVITESATTRTLVLSDAGAYILCSHASGCAITVPPQSSVEWPDGCEIHGRGSLGNVTFVEGSGVTIDIPAGETLAATAKTAWMLKREAENSWALIGNLVDA